MDRAEHTTVSSTGGVKGTKLCRPDLIPVDPLVALAELYGYGCQKYDERNWERGYNWSLSYAALQRHLMLFWSGEDNDPESWFPHIIHAAWHCLALAEFLGKEKYQKFDDRPIEASRSTDKPKRNVIYVSGPMRGYPDYNRAQFIGAKEKAVALVPDHIEVVTPLDNESMDELSELAVHEGMDPGEAYMREALLGDCELICKRTIALVTLPGWRHSKGATAEVKLAVALGIPCVYLHETYFEEEISRVVANYSE